MTSRSTYCWERIVIDLDAINRREIARLVDMSPSSIGRILSGKRQPSVLAARKIAHALDLSVDEFLKLLPAA